MHGAFAATISNVTWRRSKAFSGAWADVPTPRPARLAVYEEGIKVPLIIHDPRQSHYGERVESLSSQIDILPTVMDLLDYRVENGEYPGYSLLNEPPEDRALYSSCWFEDKCMASVKGHEKYIHHHGNPPDEFFGLLEDLAEQNDLTGEYSQEQLDERRDELLEWRSNTNATYTTIGG